MPMGLKYNMPSKNCAVVIWGVIKPVGSDFLTLVLYKIENMWLD